MTTEQARDRVTSALEQMNLTLSDTQLDQCASQLTDLGATDTNTFYEHLEEHLIADGVPTRPFNVPVQENTLAVRTGIRRVHATHPLTAQVISEHQPDDDQTTWDDWHTSSSELQAFLPAVTLNILDNRHAGETYTVTQELRNDLDIGLSADDLTLRAYHQGRPLCVDTLQAALTGTPDQAFAEALSTYLRTQSAPAMKALLTYDAPGFDERLNNLIG